MPIAFIVFSGVIFTMPIAVRKASLSWYLPDQQSHHHHLDPNKTVVQLSATLAYSSDPVKIQTSVATQVQ